MRQINKKRNRCHGCKPPIGDEPRSFNGSFVVAQAATKEEVTEELRKDVYAQRGVWDLDKV